MYNLKLNLLDELSRNSIKVLEIWHPSRPDDVMFFETGDFRPALVNSGEKVHSLSRSKNITHIIDQSKGLYINNPNVIKSVIAAIESLEIGSVKKQFSSDFSFIWHT